MSELTRDETADPVSRETKLSGANGDGEKKYFPCSADHKQDWEPYSVDPYRTLLKVLTIHITRPTSRRVVCLHRVKYATVVFCTGTLLVARVCVCVFSSHPFGKKKCVKYATVVFCTGTLLVARDRHARVEYINSIN